MSDGQRHSVADQPSLIDDPIEEAKKEAENAVAQIDRVMDMIDDVVRGGRPFRLRTSMIFDLHRIALQVSMLMQAISGQATSKSVKASTNRLRLIWSPSWLKICAIT